MSANLAGRLVQSLSLAQRNLLRQRRRTLLAIATVCAGIVAYLLAGGFIEWVLERMRESTIHSQLGHIQITRPDFFSKGLADPYGNLLPPDATPVAEAAPGHIRTVAPRLPLNGLLSKGDATVSFIGEGIDPVREAPISRSMRIVGGVGLAASDARSVLLGAGLASSIGAQPGDTVVLLATTASGGVNAVELTVAGNFATSSKAYDDTALRVPIDVARALVRVEGATSWVVLLDETRNTDAVAAELRRRLSASEFEIVPWYRLADFYNKTAELFGRQVTVVRLLIAIIVVLSISNTLSMTVIERTGEIGTAMALGVRRRGILGLFLLEGSLLGLAGGVVGVALAYVLAAIVSHVGIPMPPPPGMDVGFTGRILISPGLAVDAFALAFATTLLASILPAWKASRMNIVDALRHQR